MAALIFMRDGTGEHQYGNRHEIPIKAAREIAQRFGYHYFELKPTFNEGTASWVSNFRHVLVEVGESEIGEVFDRSGFYFIAGLDPSQAVDEFHLPTE